MVIYSRAILVDTVSRMLSVKSGLGTLANSADLNQTQNAVYDQGLHCLLKLQEVKG